MQFDELKQRAAGRAAGLPKSPDLDAARDRLRADVAGFLEKLPEPPVYRRRDDPLVAQAGPLLAEGEALLARVLQLDEPGLSGWAEALEAHLLARCLLTEGRVEAAEDAWARAVARERQAAREKRVWARTDEQPAPVYDGATGTSRFDPRPEPAMQVKLMCPACRAVGDYAFSPRHSTHQFACRACRVAFWAYVGELRSVETRQLSKARRRYSMRLEELTGGLTRVEFDDSSGGAFSSARRDLIAFLYAPRGTLRGVLDLSSGRALWLQASGPCFVATAAFGPDAPELHAFRGFRDRVLLRSAAGRALVAAYYAAGPALARQVVRRPALQRLTRGALTGIHWALKRSGY